MALHPAPCTLHPAPRTPHPAPRTLNPEPLTLKQVALRDEFGNLITTPDAFFIQVHKMAPRTKRCVYLSVCLSRGGYQSTGMHPTDIS